MASCNAFLHTACSKRYLCCCLLSCFCSLLHACLRPPSLRRSLYRHVRGLAQAQGVCGIRLYADSDNARAQATVRPWLCRHHSTVMCGLCAQYCAQMQIGLHSVQITHVIHSGVAD